ncbi:MAG: ABC-2 family transporter protein [bacterium]|jgi:ABC-2 type transport system permease protein|nr:ABC-2 family transporter protein [bacterium]
MGRHLRLYLHFLRFSFSRAMEFRVDFFFRIVMDAAFYAVQLAFFGVLYRHTALLGGWDLDQAIVFACGFFLIDALHMTIFANNMWWLPIFVNKGDLDYYLTRPVSPLFFLSLRDFAANSFVNLLIAVALLAWALGRYPGPLDPLAAGVFILLLLNGAILYWLVHLAFLIPVFWLHSSRGLGETFYVLEKYSERPDRIFRGWVRRILVTALPFALISSFPTALLFEGVSPALLGHVLGVTALFFLAVLGFWRLALRNYASASS